jgi:hypothetical protein
VAAEEVTAGAGKVTGTVRLGLPSLFGIHLVAPQLASLLEAQFKRRGGDLSPAEVLTKGVATQPIERGQKGGPGNAFQG